MSNSNGYNPNSLLTLEQSLLAPKQESEEHPNQHVEAQAFDWDESIDLDYSEAESWHYPNYGSQSFDIEEDIETYDVQAFEVEEAEPTLDYQDPLSQSNSLFALEQSVLGVNAPYQASLQFSVEEEEELERQPAESQAFDWDEAIALKYEESAYPTAQSFGWLPSHESYGFNLDDEPPTYEVEAFEVEEPQPEATEEEYSSSKEYDFNINNDNNNLSNNVAEASYDTQAYGFDADDEPEPIYQKKSPSPPIKAPEPVEALSDDDFDEFERASTEGRASDAEAFTADLASILRGEKVYEPPKETPVQTQSAPFSSTPQPSAPQPQSPPPPVTPKQARPHDVFNQMGRNVSHATAFDLGTFSLEQRFDEFDRMLDEEEYQSTKSPRDATVKNTNVLTSPATSSLSLQLDNSDLAEDFGIMDEWLNQNPSNERVETSAIINRVQNQSFSAAYNAPSTSAPTGLSCWASDLDRDEAQGFAITNEWTDQNSSTQLAEDSATISQEEGDKQNFSDAYATPSTSERTGLSCWASDLDH